MTDIPHLLNLLFSTFPPRQPEEGVDPRDHVAAQLEAFSRALRSYEIGDIEAAIDRFLEGRVKDHNPNFAPSAAMLATVVRQCMNERLDAAARDRIRQPALPPPDVVHTPEERERVAALAASFIAKSSASMLTQDAAKAKLTDRQREIERRVVESLQPPMDPASVKRRLGFSVGDPEGDSEVA